MPTHPLILITGGRGRLASAAREALAAAGMDTRSFSRTAGEGHLALEDLLVSVRMRMPSCTQRGAPFHLCPSAIPAVNGKTISRGSSACCATWQNTKQSVRPTLSSSHREVPFTAMRHLVNPVARTLLCDPKAGTASPKFKRSNSSVRPAHALICLALS